MAGPQEKLRAVDFIKTIQICPDVQIAEELTKLNVGGKIKPRSLLIFSFGLIHKCITVTANEGFIRSARMQVQNNI